VFFISFHIKFTVLNSSDAVGYIIFKNVTIIICLSRPTAYFNIKILHNFTLNDSEKGREMADARACAEWRSDTLLVIVIAAAAPVALETWKALYAGGRKSAILLETLSG
jgi:hypothetical protein